MLILVNQVNQTNQAKLMIWTVPLAQTFLEQRCNESGEPGEPNDSGESDDLKGSFSAYILGTKMEWIRWTRWIRWIRFKVKQSIVLSAALPSFLFIIWMILLVHLLIVPCPSCSWVLMAHHGFSPHGSSWLLICEGSVTFFLTFIIWMFLLVHLLLFFLSFLLFGSSC